MSFETRNSAKGDDLSKCYEVDIKPDTDIMAQNPHSNIVHGNRNEDKKKSEPPVSPTDTDDPMVIKPAPGILLHQTDSKFELSSLPDSHDIREEESVGCTLSKTTINFRRRSSEWSDELSKVATITNIEPLQVEAGVSQTGFDLILTELQCGIRESLNKLPKYPERDLLMTDFGNVEEINLCNEELCTSDSSSVLYAYAPVAFRFFRDLFGITTEDFAQSVCGAPLYHCTSSSRSGSDFFSTSDDRFIFKTVPKKEARFLMSLFPGYFMNLTQHTKTLLPKYYGLYFYEKDFTKSIRVLIMNNILPRSYKFSEKYDLKGSTYSKRRSSEMKISHGNEPVDNATLKDLDFLDRWPHGFYLDKEIHNLLLKSVERDCKALESYDIMDYSLLLGVVLPDDPNSPVQVSNLTPSRSSVRLHRNKNLIGPFEARTMKGDMVYLFVGMIDILQSYTWKRKLEYHAKSLFYSRNSISVNRPSFYSQRFQNFLKDKVFKCIPKLVPSSKRECCIGIMKGVVNEDLL